MKIFYISDFFLDELQFSGGAEYNDHILVNILREKNHNVKFFKSINVTLDLIKENQDHLFIISNFLMLKNDCIEEIIENCSYIIYEHDHKYLRSRNPILYKNFKAPKQKIVNHKFYQCAKYVFCQSSFHEKIININLNLNNTYNISGNLWSSSDLDYILNLSKGEKNADRHSILKSSIWNKNSEGAIEFCNKNNLKYDLIADENYHKFLKKIASNKKFLFLPRSPETLSRVCVEAKMLGCSLIVNNLVGAKYENWFRFDGEEIVDYMRNIGDKILKRIEQ